MFGIYNVEKYLFIGMKVRNKKIISTEIITAVAFLSLKVYTMQYPISERSINIKVIMIFLSDGSNFPYLNACANP